MLEEAKKPSPSGKEELIEYIYKKMNEGYNSNKTLGYLFR